MTKESIPEFFTKSIQAVLAALVTILAWMLAQLYGQMTNDMAELNDKVDSYQIRSVDSSRGSDEKLARYMLEIERRLSKVEIKVGIDD
tara:strand:- start:5113 stop:5376 length:264 start_codon:yes stop_codon:yes gene_type:complete